MGDSEKIRAGAEPDRYRFASHARYVDANEMSMVSVCLTVALV